MADRHPATCVCYDCLPGGAREHRVRPWPCKVEDCDHPDADQVLGVTRAKTRLVLTTMGGGTIEQCRLCGAIFDARTGAIVSTPPSP